MGASDHVGISGTLNIGINKNNDIGNNKRDFWRADYPALNQYLMTNICCNTMENMSTEDAWLYLKRIIHEGIEECVPLKKPWKKNIKHLPKDVKVNIWERNKLWKIYKVTNRISDYERYTLQRNIVKTKIHEWERLKEQELIKSMKGNVKKFFGYVRQKQRSVAKMCQVKNADNKLTTTEEETAQVMANFFESVFINNEPEVEEGDKTRRDTIDELSDIRIEESIVRDELLKLNVEKSAGPDGIGPKVLKECADVLAIRVFLKNESLRTTFSNPPLHYACHREAVVKIIAQNNNI